MRSSTFRFFCVLLSAVWLLSLAVPVLGAGAVPETTARDLSIEVAGESAVLLENNGALPFESGVRIALFGYNQIDFHPGGGGSCAMPDDGREIVTVLDALQKAETSGQLSLDPDLVRFYKGISRETVPGADLITQAAGRSDAAVVCIGRWSEEGVDRKPEPGSFYLSKEEKALLGAVRSAFDKVVVLLNLCGVTDLSWATDSATRTDALLLIGMPGQYGADCLPDLLLGRISPSGRLSDTFADSYDAYPSSRNFGQVNTYYEEDIYVGYRYFET
ncbi:MAG: glycoside hydrolase family 3 C-terminal domain-containing protein, partial [Clostridia bacterium]|nr:glycoside hydrolase family 3 C-terminal domain-containing protein [Clostridia bacterium]